MIMLKTMIMILILRADGTTLYAKTYVDITQDIIDKLN